MLYRRSMTAGSPLLAELAEEGTGVWTFAASVGTRNPLLGK